MIALITTKSIPDCLDAYFNVIGTGSATVRENVFAATEAAVATVEQVQSGSVAAGSMTSLNKVRKRWAQVMQIYFVSTLYRCSCQDPNLVLEALDRSRDISVQWAE